MSAQTTQQVAPKKLLLVRMIPGKKGKQWGFRGMIMKSGIYHKGSQEVCRLLLQRKYADGTPRFEVDSLKSAVLKIQQENPNHDPRQVLHASALPPTFVELEDEKATASTRYRDKQAISFDALMRDAQNGDLHMDVEDEEFLQQMVTDQSPIRSRGDSAADARLSAMEATISRLTEALEVSQKMARGGREQAPPKEDPYDVNVFTPEETPPDEISDEELEKMIGESDIAGDELPEQIDFEQSLAQAEAAEIEEQRAEARKARSAKKKAGKKKASKKAGKKTGKKANKKSGKKGVTPGKKPARTKRNVPKLG